MTSDHDFTAELAQAIAELSDGHPQMIVLAATMIRAMTRKEQLKFLAGDLSVFQTSKLTRKLEQPC